MKKRQIGIRLTDAQIAHFEALAEKEGCESIAEMFRKAAFSRWPMNKSANCAPTVANCVPTVANSVPTQEEKKEEREKSPHTPLKEKEGRKEEPLHSRAHARDERFAKPTVEEIAAYCRSRNNGLDPEQIWDFYESKGWFIGKTKMKNWRSAVRTWERRRREEQNAATSANVNSRYHNGRPKLSNHVDISEEKRNEILEGFGF